MGRNADPRRITIARLLLEGRTKEEVVAMGYPSLHVSQIAYKIQKGWRPDGQTGAVNESDTRQSTTARTANTSQPGGNLAIVTAARPAATVFRLGREDIEIDEKAFYEAYLLYKDMSIRGLVKDNFGVAIFDAIENAWKVLNVKPIIKENQISVEVNHG